MRALIVDDERHARVRLRRMLSGEADVEVIGECESAEEAKAFLDQQHPDVLFLDIQMPGIDGFGLLEQIRRERTPLVVFVTAYDDHALKAFDVQAFDYLLKPFDKARLQVTLARAAEFLSASAPQANPVPAADDGADRISAMVEQALTRRQAAERIAIRSSGKVSLVKASEIDWIEAANNYVCLHVRGETHVLRETMNSLEARLDTRQFARIHRSVIVNLDRIKELQPWFNGDYVVLLDNGAKLTMSRNYRDRLESILG